MIPLATLARSPDDPDAPTRILHWLTTIAQCTPISLVVATTAILAANNDPFPLTADEQDWIHRIALLPPSPPPTAPTTVSAQAPLTTPRCTTWLAAAFATIHPLPLTQLLVQLPALDDSTIDPHLPLPLQQVPPSWPNHAAVRDLFPPPTPSVPKDLAYAPPSTLPFVLHNQANQLLCRSMRPTAPKYWFILATLNAGEEQQSRALPRCDRMETLDAWSFASIDDPIWRHWLDHAPKLHSLRFRDNSAPFGDLLRAKDAWLNKGWTTLSCTCAPWILQLRTIKHLDLDGMTPAVAGPLLAQAHAMGLLQLTARGSITTTALTLSQLKQASSLLALHLRGPQIADDCEHGDDLPGLRHVSFTGGSNPISVLCNKACFLTLQHWPTWSPPDHRLACLTIEQPPTSDAQRRFLHAWLRAPAKSVVAPSTVVNNPQLLDCNSAEISLSDMTTARTSKLRHLTLHVRREELCASVWMQSCQNLRTLSLHLSQPLRSDTLDVPASVRWLRLFVPVIAELWISGGRDLSVVEAPNIQLAMVRPTLVEVSLSSIAGGRFDGCESMDMHHDASVGWGCIPDIVTATIRGVWDSWQPLIDAQLEAIESIALHHCTLHALEEMLGHIDFPPSLQRIVFVQQPWMDAQLMARICERHERISMLVHAESNKLTIPHGDSTHW
jgi:hypothetical protein